MKTTISALLFIALAAMATAQIPILKDGDYSFTFYGFAKFDAVYQDHAMNSNLSGRYPLPDTAANDASSTNLTAMNSRFGFRWTGPTLDSGTRIGGNVEWDLYDPSSRNQMKFRTRLAYLELRGAAYSLIAGQHWDIFGAGSPKTLLTQGFYWETGNTGYRRAQVRYTRFFGDAQDLAFSIGDPTTDAAINNNMPVFEARYGFKWGEGKKNGLGVFAAYSREMIEGDKVPIEGAGFDFTMALTPALSLMGEAAHGRNLKIFLTRGSYLKTADGTYDTQSVTAGWMELVYSIKTLDLYAGYSKEHEPDVVSATALGDSDAAFAGIAHKLGKGVSYGLEITHFTGNYQGLKKARANQADFAVTYTF